MSLDQARGARMKAREQVKNGVKPAQERREKIQQLWEIEDAEKKFGKTTFEFIATEWIVLEGENWSKKHADAVYATLAHDAFPLIGNLQIDIITAPQVLKVLMKYWKPWCTWDRS